MRAYCGKPPESCLDRHQAPFTFDAASAAPLAGAVFSVPRDRTLRRRDRTFVPPRGPDVPRGPEIAAGGYQLVPSPFGRGAGGEGIEKVRCNLQFSFLNLQSCPPADHQSVPAAACRASDC